SAQVDELSISHGEFDGDNVHDKLFGIPDDEWVDTLIEMYGKRIRKIFLYSFKHAAISESEANRLYQIISSKKLEVLISSNLSEDPHFERIEGYTVKVFSEHLFSEKFRFEMKHNTVSSPQYNFYISAEEAEVRTIE
ncbi:hypothetical protein PFISCL1PPCAC_536, partial [Pristionchus fissidentatus]